MNEVDRLCGCASEDECTVMRMRTTLALHPFNEAFMHERGRVLLAMGVEFAGEMSLELLAQLGAQA